MEKILLVDDDKEFSEIFTDFLVSNGFYVDCINDAYLALNKVKEKEYDLLIIDLYLEKFSGTQLVELMKVDYKRPKVIIMTNSSDDMDEIKSLQLGVDEYIRKTISINVMLQRIKNVLSKETTKTSKEFIYESPSEHIKLDAINRFVTKNGEVAKLTYLEFDLLECFLKNTNVLLTREEILEQVWQLDQEQTIVDSRTVDVHIKNIRRKLNLKAIHSMRGLGYRWHER